MQCTYELLHANTRGRRGKYKIIKVHITLCVLFSFSHWINSRYLTQDTVYILFVGRLIIMWKEIFLSILFQKYIKSLMHCLIRYFTFWKLAINVVNHFPFPNEYVNMHYHSKRCWNEANELCDEILCMYNIPLTNLWFILNIDIDE